MTTLQQRSKTSFFRKRVATVSPVRSPERVVNEPRQNRHWKLIRLLFLTVLPSITVITQSTINLNSDVQSYQANIMVRDKVSQSVELGELIHLLQLERGTTAMYLSSNQDPFVMRRLANVYRTTDVIIQALNPWMKNDRQHFKSKAVFKEYLWLFRRSLDPNNTTLLDTITFYTDINEILLDIIWYSVNIAVPLSFWTEISSYELLMYSKEQAGIERALGSTYYVRGQLPINDLLWYNEKSVLGQTFLDQCMKYSQYVRDRISVRYLQTNLDDNISIMRKEITMNALKTPSVSSGTTWFDNMTDYIDILKEMQDSLAFRIKEYAENDNEALRSTLIGSSIQLSIAIIMLPIIIVLVRNVVSFSSRLRERTKVLEEEKQQTCKLLGELDDERKRTEELLYQLLPKSVAQKLMSNGSATPESYESATIMFTDVVGFTQIASCSTPLQVVQMLNKLYLTIDRRLENFDVYKVETIGDAYMVASGIPNRNGDRHVEEIAKLAISLLQTLELMVIPHRVQEKMKLRIGFDTGPCAAGVVGDKMPRYCLFGDTVNTASRMESTGLPLQIQITEASAKKLKKFSGYVIKERGSIEIKGKGLMKTFWLDGYQKSPSP